MLKRRKLHERRSICTLHCNWLQPYLILRVLWRLQEAQVRGPVHHYAVPVTRFIPYGSIREHILEVLVPPRPCLTAVALQQHGCSCVQGLRGTAAAEPAAARMHPNAPFWSAERPARAAALSFRGEAMLLGQLLLTIL